MLVRALSANVVVRSGQRVQLVWCDALGCELYVFSEHAICASLVHQCPSWQGVHAVPL